MGEEAVDDYELHMVSLAGAGDEDERVMEWESGLPSADELTPLSQALVPPGLAAAFRIPPEPGRTLLDVHRASAATVSRLRRAPSSSGGSGTSSLAPFEEEQQQPPPPQQPAPHPEKRPRLVWTPQLHKRFVDVVAHLGMKQAVPKTIMQLMNVEGLTRENVASHLQKYRLYVKRGMQGLSNDKDDIFASTPVPPHTLHDPHPQPQVQVPYTRHAAHYQYHHHQSSSNGYHHAGGYHHHGDK